MSFTRGVLVTSLLLASSCGALDPNQRSSSMILLPEAREVVYEVGEGGEKLSYQTPAGYPAGHVIESLAESLREQGWRPFADNWYNEGQTSSYTRGWSVFVSVPEPDGQETQTYQWWAQWTNDAGEVLDYSLHYFHPVGQQPVLDTLHVQGIRLSGDLAQELRLRSEPPGVLPSQTPVNATAASDHDPQGETFDLQ